MNSQKLKIKITRVGIYLPPSIQKSEEIAPLIGKSKDWIIRKSGVSERRVSSIDVDKMGALAGKDALDGSKIPDLIINASGVPKQTIPDTSIFIQKELGFEGIPSFSVHSTCLSFITALHIASTLLHSNTYKCILIVSSDRGTRGRNFLEPESASLLGDGAAAALIEKGKNDDDSELIYYDMKTWPTGSNLTEVRGGGTNKHPQDSVTRPSDNLFTMDGPAIYKIARKQVYQMMLKTLKAVGISQNEIDWVVPHQASGKAIEAYSSIGKFDKRKVINILPNYGNCVAASIPMSLAVSIKDGRIKRGDLVLFIGTGAGLSAASLLIRY